MNKYCIVFLLSTVISFSGYTQSEIMIYGGVYDYPGIAFEYSLTNKLGVEIGASFRTKNDGEWHGLKLRDNNLFINGMLKKYHANKSGNTNFYYGGYLRYWYTNNFTVDAEQRPLPTSIQSLLDSDYEVTYATETNKISIGILAGYKLLISERLSFGITSGIGFSFPFAYWKKEYRYNQEDRISRYGKSAFIGYLYHLSFIGNISLGYRFGKRSV